MLGKNSLGSNRNRGAPLRKRIRCTKTDAGRGASRLIPPEFCGVRWMQLGSAQSIAIRGS
jgi:hypothetical protein